MAQHFETLAKAKKEFKRITGIDYDDKKPGEITPISIYNRNKQKWRKSKLKRPFFVGSYMEYINL